MAVFIIGMSQLFIVFKRQLAELRLLSYIFLGIVIAFIMLLISELLTDRVEIADTIDIDDLISFKDDYHIITAASILVFAFSVQFMVFPTYCELDKRTTSRYSTVSKIATSIYGISFIATACVGVLLFG